MKIKKFNKLLSYIDKLSEVEKEYLKSILNTNNSNNKEIMIGDEITISHSIYGDIPFIVIGKDHDADNSVTLLTKEIVRLLAFDSRETYNTNDERQDYGNNRYKYSNILQWMNSDKVGGEWYEKQHSYDEDPYNTSVVSYNPYSNIDGLLRGFNSGVVKEMIKVDKITTIPITDGSGSETVSSKVFLLSNTEVGLANENSIEEGSIYEYFSNNNTNNQRLAYPSEYCLNNAGGYTSTSFVSGKAWYWWLRTPHSGHSYNTRIVSTSGTLSYSYAYLAHYGLRFAFCLPTEIYLKLKKEK